MMFAGYTADMASIAATRIRSYGARPRCDAVVDRCREHTDFALRPRSMPTGFSRGRSGASAPPHGFA